MLRRVRRWHRRSGAAADLEPADENGDERDTDDPLAGPTGDTASSTWQITAPSSSPMNSPHYAERGPVPFRWSHHHLRTPWTHV